MFRDDPIIMQTIKQENTKPNGHLPPAESRIGVHRKTKMYITDSNIDWQIPSNKIVGSWKITRNPWRHVRPKPSWRPPKFSVQLIEMKTPLTTRQGIAIMNGATGPKPNHSAPISEAMPAIIAKTPFQKVVTENVEEIHSEGKQYFSLC